MGDEPVDNDPGWPSGALLLLAVVPVFGMQLARRRLADRPLVLLRFVFLSFTASLVLFGVVLAVLPSSHRATHTLPWTVILAVVAFCAVLGTQFIVRRPLRCGSDVELAGTYRSRMFGVVAFSETVALAGFVFAFIGGPRWIYDIGAVFALAQFWTVAPPTAGDLARVQRALAEAGCTRSLVGALNRSDWAPPGTL